MIILYSKNSTILRVPKTGSTTLQSSIRFSPGCFGEGDRSTGVDDANLSPINIDDYVSFFNQRLSLSQSIRNKKIDARANGTDAIFTDDEQALIDLRTERASNNTFTQTPLPHATLDDLTDENSWGFLNYLTTEQIQSFNHYAFIRNPLKRIISGYLFSWSRIIPLTISNFHNFVNSDDFAKGLVFRKQIDYFKYNNELIVTPLLFENYETEMNNLITTLGGTCLSEYPKFKSGIMNTLSLSDPKPSVENWIEPYSDIKDKILNHYSEDVTLWENTSGQTL